ncbi:hypothetical protein LCGC14_2304130, partial [marine sediment metagenome]
LPDKVLKWNGEGTGWIVDWNRTKGTVRSAEGSTTETYDCDFSTSVKHE